jgi:hypothetical protein
VAFGDIRGFGAWTSRAANSRETKDPFIRRFYYEVLEDYTVENPDVYFKYLGDGFMALKEFDKKEEENVFNFIKNIKKLSKRLLNLVKESGYPPPDGYRVRISSGDVYKMSIKDPNDKKRKRKVPEYVEYATNQAAHLLKVNPEIVCLATESVVKSLGKYRSFFRVRSLERPSAYPESVNKQDIETLQILKF